MGWDEIGRGDMVGWWVGWDEVGWGMGWGEIEWGGVGWDAMR